MSNDDMMNGLGGGHYSGNGDYLDYSIGKGIYDRGVASNKTMWDAIHASHTSAPIVFLERPPEFWTKFKYMSSFKTVPKTPYTAGWEIAKYSKDNSYKLVALVKNPSDKIYTYKIGDTEYKIEPGKGRRIPLASSLSLDSLIDKVNRNEIDDTSRDFLKDIEAKKQLNAFLKKVYNQRILKGKLFFFPGLATTIFSAYIFTSIAMERSESLIKTGSLGDLSYRLSSDFNFASTIGQLGLVASVVSGVYMWSLKKTKPTPKP